MRYVPAGVGEADAGGVAVELAGPERGGHGVLGLGGGAEGREHGGVPVRQRQHGPRVARVHARADLEPRRPDAHLVRPGHVLGRRRPREPPLRRRVPAAVLAAVGRHGMGKRKRGARGRQTGRPRWFWVGSGGRRREGDAENGLVWCGPSVPPLHLFIGRRTPAPAGLGALWWHHSRAPGHHGRRPPGGTIHAPLPGHHRFGSRDARHDILTTAPICPCLGGARCVRALVLW